MSIEAFHTITKEETFLLKDLLKKCLQHDKTVPDMHWSQMADAGVPSTFVFKKDGQLQGLLKLFFFYDNAVEITLLVHPKARRQGIASKLYLQALPILKIKNIQELRFSFADTQSNWLNRLGAQFKETEYTLLNPLEKTPAPLQTLDKALLTHSQDLIELDILCFSERSLTKERIKDLIQKKNYDIWVFIKDGKAIAKLHLEFDFDVARIFDVAVHPDHQRQGYATLLLHHALNYSKRAGMKHAQLDVISHNERALTLYLKNGFICQHSHHYWRMKI